MEHDWGLATISYKEFKNMDMDGLMDHLQSPFLFNDIEPLPIVAATSSYYPVHLGGIVFRNGAYEVTGQVFRAAVAEGKITPRTRVALFYTKDTPDRHHVSVRCYLHYIVKNAGYHQVEAKNLRRGYWLFSYLRDKQILDVYHDDVAMTSRVKFTDGSVAMYYHEDSFLVALPVLKRPHLSLLSYGHGPLWPDALRVLRFDAWVVEEMSVVANKSRQIGFTKWHSG